MSGALETKGAAALARVKNKIKNIGDLTVLINGTNSGGNITSCNLTANILADIIDPSFFFKSKNTTVHLTVQAPVMKVSTGSTGGFGDMMHGLQNKTGVSEATALRQEDRVNKIAELLGTPVMVYICTSPDHHFIVFSINDLEVVILQGFQGVYNLIQWMSNASKGGVLRRASFIQALRDLVGNNASARTAAAAALFCYDDQATTSEVVKYYKDEGTIQAIGYRSL